MIDRPFWLQRIEAAWKEASIVWLCGVRRSGKTTLAQQLGEARVHYVNSEYVLRQSGGQLEVTRTASALGISRPTVESHLQALEITRALTLVRPFHGGGQKELVKQPKAYAFDTGFVSFARGWDPLRPEDCGLLWEHLVLENLQAAFPDEPVRYWRDKAGREVDFVRVRSRDEVDAIECKWDASGFDPAALKVFRTHYPKGRNYLVTPLTGSAYLKRFQTLEVKVCSPTGLV